MATGCALCRPMNGEIAAFGYWRVVVNLNQDKLGKVMLVLRRHEEDVCSLDEDEVSALWAAMRGVRSALDTCFQPDHYNYSFLMNQDRHVHLHIIPRYRGTRTFAGVEFTDDERIPEQRLPAYQHEQIVTVLRDALPSSA